MRKMTFDEFDKLQEKYKRKGGLPPINHGITEHDMEVMEKNPEDFLDFAIYLLTLPAYKDFGDKSYRFMNADAADPTDIAFRLDTLIKDNIELYDEED